MNRCTKTCQRNQKSRYGLCILLGKLIRSSPALIIERWCSCLALVETEEGGNPRVAMLARHTAFKLLLLRRDRFEGLQ